MEIIHERLTIRSLIDLIEFPFGVRSIAETLRCRAYGNLPDDILRIKQTPTLILP